MAKKLFSDIDYFEGYHLLGIVSQLKDYNLAFNLNNELDIDLKKFEDISLCDNDGNNHSYSWYFYSDETILAKIYMISNSSGGSKLIPSKKELDYFLLWKDFPSEEYILDLLPLIRKIQNVLAVFKFDLNEIKDAEIIIENIEIHEIENLQKIKKEFKSVE